MTEWFRLVMKRDEMEAEKVVMRINVEGKRGRDRPKKRWLDTTMSDVRAASVCINVEDQDKRS